ncbi:Nuclear receptor 2C2-associated protein [Araneus ventricosus]|uniref:Nuclear receptor 2C2-associated protein n=1 Tax=Araneus ventricosus TaxID=182803 RepID=A0A4Y2HJF7_ARAVE|nr:Nuclear receptor 2C2-associated protein [Araneus ventricosus]
MNSCNVYFEDACVVGEKSKQIMSSIIKNCSSLRVSSVLNKNAKEFGKQYMIDDCDDTCWNSDQGSPQWVEVNFPQPVTVEEVHIQFQGGFAGKECWVEAKSDGELSRISSIYPEDSNALQISFKVL